MRAGSPGLVTVASDPEILVKRRSVLVGPLEVWDQGGEVSLGGTKPRVLLVEVGSSYPPAVQCRTATRREDSTSAAPGSD